MASLSCCLEPPIKPCLGVIWGWKLLPHEQLKAGRVTGPPCHTLSFQIKICKGDAAANFPWAVSIPGLRGEDGVIGVNCLIMIIATVWGKEQASLEPCCTFGVLCPRVGLAQNALFGPLTSA